MTLVLRKSFGMSLAGLSDEEVHSLARGGSRLAVEHLLLRYRGLVEGKARAYFVLGADPEDVVQEGMIGLYKAIRDYRSEKLVRFRCFAELCITRQIVSAVKSASRHKHVPLNRYVSLERSSADEDSYLGDMIPGERSAEPEWAVLGLRLREVLERPEQVALSELERQVVRARIEGKSYVQMAAELHCPAKRVDNALQRARRKLWTEICRARAEC